MRERLRLVNPRWPTARYRLSYVGAQAYSEDVKRRKNPNAVKLGRLGGKKGGRARAEKMTPEARSASARAAAIARWAKAKKEQS